MRGWDDMEMGRYQGTTSTASQEDVNVGDSFTFIWTILHSSILSFPLFPLSSYTKVQVECELSLCTVIQHAVI